MNETTTPINEEERKNKAIQLLKQLGIYKPFIEGFKKEIGRAHV